MARRSLLLIVALLAFVGPAAGPSQQDKELAEAKKFKILYAGKRNGPRETNFIRLLITRFGKVDAINLEQLDARKAAPYDVVIADIERRNPNDNSWDPRKPKVALDASFTKPVILIGAVAGEIQRRSKISRFSLDLMNEAHGLRRDHAIFKGPLDPKLETTAIPTPDHYRKTREGKDLPAMIDTWHVQTGELPKVIDYGMVANPWGFEDSPDAEIISSGLNGLTHRAVALGRHGNFFLWGFAGDPAQMTESARRVFINAICYMKKFDGRPPLAPAVMPARDMAFVYITWWRQSTDRVRDLEWAKKYFPPEVMDRTKMDPDKMEAFYTENLEYICPDNGMLGLDRELKDLKLSNRRMEFWDKILTRIAKPEKDAAAWTLVERYAARKKFKDAAEVHTWFEENKSYLFFTDVGGFGWYVDENARKDNSPPNGK